MEENKENKTLVKAMTLTELARKYEVSNKTMYSWLKKCSIIKGKRNGYLFTPKEIKIIYEKLGEPEE